jgi:hypothetical protein
MKSLNTKLILSAIGIAMLATPAFAQRPHQQPAHRHLMMQAPSTDDAAYGARVGDTYPNPQVHSGSEQSVQSGNEFIGGY